MASFVGKIAGKKAGKNYLTKQFGPPDPYYESYSDDKGKQKRRKRALPPGLSKRDASILRSVQKRAHRLDEGFHICGMEFGWTFVIGIVPVVGDVANLVLNHTLVVKAAKKADIPASLFRSMIMHNLISTGVGMVPAIGDICVAIYKPNSRNAAMLENFLRIRGEEALKLLNPEEAGRSVVSGKKGRAWFRRNRRKSDQATGMNTMPSGAGSIDLIVDERPASRISSGSNKHQEREISATTSEKNASTRGNKNQAVAQRPKSRKGKFLENWE